MIRNGITIPFPSELATPPASSSQTGRGSCGLSPLRYAATAFRAARGYPGKRRLPSVLIDSSIENRIHEIIRGQVLTAEFAESYFSRAAPVEPGPPCSHRE